MEMISRVMSFAACLPAFRMMLLLACISCARAQTPLIVEGEPSWSIHDGVCDFMLSGNTRIINNDVADAESGSLRFILWLSAKTMPSPGYTISGLDFGQLKGQTYIGNFTYPAPVAFPKVTGFQYITLSLEEYYSTGWSTRYFGTPTQVYLKEGVLSPPPFWKPRSGKIIPVKVTDPTGKKLMFSHKGVQVGGKPYIIPKVSEHLLVAKLKGSGFTLVFSEAQPKGIGAKWTYKTGKAKWSGKRRDVGILEYEYTLQSGGKLKSTYWMFFQKDGRGFYKATHKDDNASFTTFGLFTLD